MVLSSWQIEPFPGLAGLAALRLLDFGRKLERWPLKVEQETPSVAWKELEPPQRWFLMRF